jgi:hypothetical protein
MKYGFPASPKLLCKLAERARGGGKDDTEKHRAGASTESNRLVQKISG